MPTDAQTDSPVDDRGDRANPWLDGLQSEAHNRAADNAGTATRDDAPTNSQPVDPASAHCRIGHCVEMPHMAFVDWQAPTHEGFDSGLFTVDLKKPVTLSTESHPARGDLRRISVVCGTHNVARIDTQAAAATALSTDIWDALSAARLNYAAHARRYRRAQAKAHERLSESDEPRQQRLPDAAREAAQGVRHVAPSPESIDGSQNAVSDVGRPVRQPMSTTKKAIIGGVLGYIVLTAAGIGAISLYVSMGESGAGSAATSQPPAAPAGPDASDTDGPVGTTDGQGGSEKWQPGQ